jgi:hypothetical protein
MRANAWEEIRKELSSRDVRIVCPRLNSFQHVCVWGHNAIKGALECHVLQLTLRDSFYHDSVNTALSQILHDIGHKEKSVSVDYARKRSTLFYHLCKNIFERQVSGTIRTN